MLINGNKGLCSVCRRTQPIPWMYWVKRVQAHTLAKHSFSFCEYIFSASVKVLGSDRSQLHVMVLQQCSTQAIAPGVCTDYGGPPWGIVTKCAVPGIAFALLNACSWDSPQTHALSFLRRLVTGCRMVDRPCRNLPT